MSRFDTIWVNARLATMTAGSVPYGAIEDGAMAARDGTIAWIGPRSQLPDEPARLAERVVDAQKRLRDVFVYFDNDMKVRAPFDAEQLRIRVNGLLAGTAPERGRQEP